MQAAAEQCVRQNYTMLHERFTSLEQEVSGRVTSVELAQAAWQAHRRLSLLRTRQLAAAMSPRSTECASWTHG